MANTLNLGNGNWATKEDSLLGYNSENGNFKPLPFDFTRASSATVVNKAGLIETVGSGEPRIDFSNDAKGALLLEPQRMNLLTYSEAFDNAYWTKSGASVTSDVAISPDGSLNAFKLVESATTSRHFMYTTTSGLTSGADYNISFYVKAAERSNIWIYDDGGANNGVAFDLTNGSIIYSNTSENYSITESINGWYKISIVSSLAVNDRYPLIELLEDSYISGKPVAYQGDGTSGVYIFGAQLEQGSYATSYIPTQGSAVTRVADSSSQTPPSGIIGQTEGTIFIDFTLKDIISATGYEFISIKTGGNYINIGSYGANYFARVFNGSLLANINSPTLIANGVRYKMAVSYANADIKFYVNGVSKGTATTGVTIPATADLHLHQSLPSASETNSSRLYNTALTDAELQALTT